MASEESVNISNAPWGNSAGRVVTNLFVCLFISNMVQRKATSYLLAADGSAA